MHIRINLSFIKNQVAPLIEHYRPDLFNFCHERAHPYDFFRELLNIYFDKPTHNMKYGLLDIRKTSLACLEPLRDEFEIHYNQPQKARADASLGVSVPDVSSILSNSRQQIHTERVSIHKPVSITNTADNSLAESIIPVEPYRPIPPPPKPVWNDMKGIWEIPEPEKIVPPPPPELSYDPILNIWKMIIPEPIIEEEDEKIESEEDIPMVSAEDAAAFLASLPANRPVVEEVDTINESTDPPPTTVKMRDVEYDPNMFIPLKTDTILDDYMSLTGGIMPATNIMVQGPSGSGKSSVLIDIGCKIVNADKKKRVLFISGEMTRIDMKGLNDRFAGFEDLDVLFLNEYNDTDTRVLLSTILATGWDMVIVDSFSEVLGSIIDTAQGTTINTKSGEKWLINQFLKHNEGGNDRKLPTMFFFILQVGKDGNFVGSNRIKHAATAFMNIEFTKNRNLYIYFSKNRRGETHNNLYFEHHSKGIHFDFKRYKEDIAIRESLKRSEVANKAAWSALLDNNNDDANTIITTRQPDAERENHRTESLRNAIETYDISGPGAPVENQIEEEDPNVTPILDRRTMHLNKQITLEESIEEIEAEQEDSVELNEVETTIIVDEEEIEEVKSKKKVYVNMPDPEPLHESEERDNDDYLAESMFTKPSLKGITLTDDEDEPDKEEYEEIVNKQEEVLEEEIIEEKIVEKSIPKDNPNSMDYSSLVEL